MRHGAIRLAALSGLLIAALPGLGATHQAHAALKWSATGSLLVARADHTATLLPNGKVLVAGGHATYVGSPQATESAELYDPATGRWSVTGAMNFPRGGHTATLLIGAGCAPHCGKVLVVGGTAKSPAELYDPGTGAWSLAGGLATPRTLHTASLLQGPGCTGATPAPWCGRVLVTGGRPTDPPAPPPPPPEPPPPPQASETSELYNPATDSWEPGDPMSTARREHTATVLQDGSVLAVGGRGTPDAAALDSAERYDLASGAWAAAGNLLVARYAHTATRLPNGTVLVTGGHDNFLNPRRSAELFDPPANGRWLIAPTMSIGRARATANLLPDGSLLLAGGGAPSLDLTSTEVYRPSAAAWTADGSLVTGRQRHTATLLSGPGCAPRCGQVLVAGGLHQRTSTIASAELGQAVPAAVTPRSVTDLAARALSSRRIELSFSALGAGGAPAAYELPLKRYVIKQSRRPITATSFPAARSLCGGVCTFAATRPRDRIKLTVEDLIPNRLYHYALRPMNDAGALGMLSNVASARTSRDRLRPGRPRGLSARALDSRRVRLRFRASGSDGRRGPAVRRYVVKQSTRPITSARRFNKARSLCRSSCRFAPRRRGARLRLVVRRLCPGRRYFYAIRAKDEGGNLSRVARFRAVRLKRRRGVTCR